jgi:hypothetical protein
MFHETFRILTKYKFDAIITFQQYVGKKAQ